MGWFKLAGQVFTLVNSIMRRTRELRIEGEYKDKFNAKVKEKLSKVEDEIINELEEEFGRGADGRFR